MSDPEDLLSEYIITACFRKMIRRFTHKSLSMPYFESLKLVDMDKIVFHESEHNFSRSDEAFFLEFLPFAVLEKAIPTKVPNILRQVNLIQEADKAKAVHSGKPPAHLDKQHKYIPIYTKDTYKEFHSLFIDLLVVFEKFLLKLKVIPPSRDTTIVNVVYVVKLVGTVLQQLAKGAVLKIHLKTIESSLEEHRRVETIAVSMPKLNEDFKQDEQDEEDERDEDLEAVQPQAQARDNYSSIQQMPLHESYSEWLKLMLVYFDAIDVLKRYVTGSRFPFKTIDIKILVSPRTSTSLLPWRDIFNLDIFSTSLPGDEHHFTSGTLKCLQDAARSNIYTSFSHLRNAQLSLDSPRFSDNRKAKEVKIYLEKISASSTVPGWKDWANDLLKIGTATPIDRNKIGDAIQLLLDSDQFKLFKFLHDADSGKEVFEFEGTMHCEATLASLLRHSKVGTIDGYEDIRTQLEVG